MAKGVFSSLKGVDAFGKVRSDDLAEMAGDSKYVADDGGRKDQDANGRVLCVPYRCMVVEVMY